MKNLLEFGVPIVCAVIAAVGAWHARENKRLKFQLRSALLECRRFHELEDFYCETIGTGFTGQLLARSGLAIKRCMRAMQRSQGGETPHASRQQVVELLEKL